MQTVDGMPERFTEPSVADAVDRATGRTYDL